MISTVRRKMLVIIVLVFAVVLPSLNAQAALTFETSLSVSEQYTDNLFFNFANKQDDFGTFVTPSITLEFTNKHVKLAGTYAPSAQFYVNNTQANTVSHGMNFDIDLPFLNRISKRLEVRVNESFNLSPDLPGFSLNSNRFNSASGGIGVNPTVSPSGAPVGGGGFGGPSGNSLNNQGILNRRGTTSFQNRARIRVGYNLTPQWDSNIQYSNTFRGGIQDSMTHAVRTGLSFKVSDNTKINGGYSLRITEFTGGTSTSSNPQAPGGNGNSTSHSLNLGAGHQLRPTIPIHVTVSATVSETEVSTTRLNFTGNGEISKIFPDGEISLRVSQGIGAGGGVAASTTLRQNAVLTASKSITRFISAFLNFGYGRNRSLAGQAIETDTYQFRGGTSMVVLEWLSGGVTYSYRNQDSGGQFGNSAQSNSVFVTLTATPDTFTFFK